MCVIVYKPEGIPVDLDVLKKCWDSNSDGAGLMFSENNKLVVAKGFMKWRTMRKYLKRRGMDQMEKRSVAFHFRIATHGSVGVDNTHPFLINENLAMMHNGIISSVDVHIGEDEDISDSEMFARRYINDAFSSIPITALTEGQPINDLFAKYIGSSKLLFMDNTGEIAVVNERLGTWKSVGDGVGMWFSNTHWIPSVNVWKHTPSKWEPRKPTTYGLGTYVKGAEKIPSNGHKFIEATKPMEHGYLPIEDEDMYCFTCATSFKESESISGFHLPSRDYSDTCCPTCGSSDTEYADEVSRNGWDSNWWDVDYKCWDCDGVFDALDKETEFVSVSGTVDRLCCPYCKGAKTYRLDDEVYVDRYGEDFFDEQKLLMK